MAGACGRCVPDALPEGVVLDHACAKLAPGLEAAAFRAWIPADARAWLVLLPGSNQDGRGASKDADWRTWAAARDLAILGVCLRDAAPQTWIERYAEAGAGSGGLLVDAVAALAEAAGRPGLAGAPLLLVGHSAGGQFAYEFACWRPQRVAGFIADKGGVYYSHLASPAARQVPGLLIIGAEDEAWRRQSLSGIWALNKRAGARWDLYEEAGAGHQSGIWSARALAFLEACLPA